MAQNIPHKPRKGFCKAVWSEGLKDCHGKEIHESSVIPRDWVEKQNLIIYLPNTQNAKKLIDSCAACPRDDNDQLKKKWIKFLLIKAGPTCTNKHDAKDILSTEISEASGCDTEPEADDEQDSVVTSKKRKRSKPKK